MAPSTATSESSSPVHVAASSIQNGWSREEVTALFELSLPDLLFRAQQVHRLHFSPNKIQASTLLSIKTGNCPEDCKYCPQSSRYTTSVEAEKLLGLETVITAAKKAKAHGATRFCMGAAWRSPKERDIPHLEAMIREVKSLGLETCMTLGMLTQNQAVQLQEAGLDYYNHNLDTDEDYYQEIITTRRYEDRLATLAAVRSAGMKVCCGGIVGMGETRENRAGLLQTLAALPKHPESVPINLLVRVAGTPLEDAAAIDHFEFVRTIAVARIVLPQSYVRLSAGRESMDESTQALCFLAGANSIFYGEKLLTTPNPGPDKDAQLLARLGMSFERGDESDEEFEDELEVLSGCGCSGCGSSAREV